MKNMSNIYLFKKFSLAAFIILMVSSLLVFGFYSRAEDDEEDEGYDRSESRYEEDYRPALISPSSENVSPVTNQLIAPVNNNFVVPISNSTTNNNQINIALILKDLKDSDQDGIGDKLDKYAGQDDFSYSLIDENNNGIADDLEILIK
jgi:hypothetical protein